jgi:hypothetical protein
MSPLLPVLTVTIALLLDIRNDLVPAYQQTNSAAAVGLGLFSLVYLPCSSERQPPRRRNPVDDASAGLLPLLNRRFAFFLTEGYAQASCSLGLKIRNRASTRNNSPSGATAAAPRPQVEIRL